MRNQIARFGALALASVLFAAPAMAQNVVQYTGTLRTGFGDSDNPTDIANNGLPICAATNPFAPSTFNTLAVDGYAYQEPSTTGPAKLRFLGVEALTLTDNNAAGPGAHGGAEIKELSTCQVVVPPFFNPRLRSRTQQADVKWPATQGELQTAGVNAATNVYNGVAVYDVAAGDGFSAGNKVIPYPFFGAGDQQNITPGPNRYGGGIPWQGGGAVQLGINTTTLTPAGNNPLATFGVAEYVNGLLPTDPTLFGSAADSTGVATGLLGGNPATMAFRTAGPVQPASQWPTLGIPADGAIKTLLGGNTATPNATPGSLVPLISPFQFSGQFQRWTTGTVRHVDAVGDFVTDRTAMGFDNAVTGGATTRQLQLVTPWGATIAKAGPFGFPIPDLGFGGVSVVTLNIQPVPEPGSMAMIGFGVAGLLGLRSMKRRNS